MPDDPAKPPRFVYVAVPLALLTVGIAVWLWMGHSYAWAVTPKSLWTELPDLESLCDEQQRQDMYYAHFLGFETDEGWAASVDYEEPGYVTYKVPSPHASDETMLFSVLVGPGYDAGNTKGRVSISGYARPGDVPVPMGTPPRTDLADVQYHVTVFIRTYDEQFNTTRFDTPSMVGLAIGGTGLLILLVALQRWSAKRIASGMEASEA